MSKKNQKLVTPAILRQAVIGSFTKLNPVYMMKNPSCLLWKSAFLSHLYFHFSRAFWGMSVRVQI